ncbi:MAG: YdcF family protein [Clostridia bacterium]|nr:YdcF family protein [Clostridia bacterium]
MDIFFTAMAYILYFAIGAFIIAEARAHKGNARGKKDYLLILGCRVRHSEAEKTLRMRAEKAAEYLRENPDTVAIACGGIVHDDQLISEAQAIEEILVSRGIDKSRIIREDKSTTTVENFRNAKAIIGDGSHSLALLSSDFHLLRARLIAKKAGLVCETVSAPSPKNEKLKNYVREFFAFIVFIIGGK